jgi:signal transduction protein with GAF and PtsI domain
MAKQQKGTRLLLKEKEQEIEILKHITQIVSQYSSLDEMLQQIIEIVTVVTKCDECFIYLFNKGKDELILRASKSQHHKISGKVKLKLGEDIPDWIAKEKKPVMVSKDASRDPRFSFLNNLIKNKYHTALSVPIVSKDEIFGVINIWHKRPHSYKDNIISLLSTISIQIGCAIENIHLYDEVKKKSKEIEILSQISSTVVSNKYLEEILNLIVTVTAEMMNSKICSIMLFDEEKQELIIKATQSLSEEYRNKPNLKVGQSISGKVVKEKKPITVLDVTKEPNYMYPEIAKKEGLCSLLSVPMMVKDRVIGVINSYTSEEHRFTEEEIKILQSVANQAAVAIENTKLIEETLSVRESLEVRKLVERAKGILMREYKITEEQAYRYIQRKSMNSGKPMKEVANAIILALGSK